MERIGLLQGRVGQGVKVREIFIYPRNVEELCIRLPSLQRAQLVAGKTAQRETATLRAVLRPGAAQDATQAALEDMFRQLTRLKLDGVEWLDAEELAVDAALLVDNKY
ncbi:hypothetical protein D3C80_1909400 [compost metagenome]